MIYVIDSIMGSGKTTAAINFMNSNRDRRYLYITPYLDETERIQERCMLLNFARPSNMSKDTGFRKTDDVKRLVHDRRNISMTHELCCRLTPDIIDEIASAQYTVFIDEVLNVFEKPDYAKDDIDIAVKAGLLTPDDTNSSDSYICYKRGEREYNGRAFRELLKYADLRQLVECTGVDVEDKYVCWMLQHQLFESSVDTFVMTYMFEGSPMKAFFQMNHLPYTMKNVSLTKDGYRFTDSGKMPEYTTHIRDLLEVCEHPKINRIGEPENALSMNWYKENCTGSARDKKEKEAGRRRRLTDEEKTGTDWLINNLRTFFEYQCASQPSERRLWSTYKDYEGMLRSRGFYKCHVPWNQKATNSYADKTALAYLVNLYMNPSLKLLFDAAGAGVTHEKYALSALVQWIWRSAIRNGEKVYLYLPSSRMRRLLNEWMDSLTSGNNTPKCETVS